jgi:hypothetical protein
VSRSLVTSARAGFMVCHPDTSYYEYNYKVFQHSNIACAESRRFLHMHFSWRKGQKPGGGGGGAGRGDERRRAEKSTEKERETKNGARRRETANATANFPRGYLRWLCNASGG